MMIQYGTYYCRTFSAGAAAPPSRRPDSNTPARGSAWRPPRPRSAARGRRRCGHCPHEHVRVRRLAAVEPPEGDAPREGGAERVKLELQRGDEAQPCRVAARRGPRLPLALGKAARGEYGDAGRHAFVTRGGALAAGATSRGAGGRHRLLERHLRVLGRRHGLALDRRRLGQRLLDLCARAMSSDAEYFSRRPGTQTTCERARARRSRRAAQWSRGSRRHNLHA